MGPLLLPPEALLLGSGRARSSTAESLLHYDVEVSGFPSSHAGHVVLLGLKEQDYPGATRLEEWPTWTLPVLQWARRQGAVTGYAHSGWGLQIRDRQIPSAEVPAFDGIGANEYIVTVTHPDAVDFISTVDTPWPWELNIWYHTLNLGFRTRISGETDFPCIYDDRVGLGRTYTKLDRLTYRGWLDALRAGRSYVSDGLSHLMDFAVNGVAVGTGDGTVTATGAVGRGDRARHGAARRGRRRGHRRHGPPIRSRTGTSSGRAWRARARCRSSFSSTGASSRPRRVVADGNPHDLRVTLPVARSGWIAARILPSSHTNPVFVHRGPAADAAVDGQRTMGPRGGRAVLAAEDAQHPRERARGGVGRVRPRAGGVPEVAGVGHRGVRRRRNRTSMREGAMATTARRRGLTSGTREGHRC